MSQKWIFSTGYAGGVMITIDIIQKYNYPFKAGRNKSSKLSGVEVGINPFDSAQGTSYKQL